MSTGRINSLLFKWTFKNCMLIRQFFGRGDLLWKNLASYPPSLGSWWVTAKIKLKKQLTHSPGNPTALQSCCVNLWQEKYRVRSWWVINLERSCLLTLTTHRPCESRDPTQYSGHSMIVDVWSWWVIIPWMSHLLTITTPTGPALYTCILWRSGSGGSLAQHRQTQETVTGRCNNFW